MLVRAYLIICVAGRIYTYHLKVCRDVLIKLRCDLIQYMCKWCIIIIILWLCYLCYNGQDAHHSDKNSDGCGGEIYHLVEQKRKYEDYCGGSH